mmetsp:Transcript_59374/g.142479  ORF Transcript_59374/g.142479 Transcript_59374/m.142479 type:complete len:236 (+) Transcript_59374:1885-2592(+)
MMYTLHLGQQLKFSRNSKEQPRLAAALLRAVTQLKAAGYFKYLKFVCLHGLAAVAAAADAPAYDDVLDALDALLRTCHARREWLLGVNFGELALGPRMQARVVEVAFKGFEELEYFHVYEVQYMGQNLRPEMWVMAERWSEWMDNSSPRLAKLGQMLRVASGEIFVRLHVLLHVDLALKWTGPREFALDRSEIVPENLIVFDRLLDEMAITHVTLSATNNDDDRVRATVRQSTLG